MRSSLLCLGLLAVAVVDNVSALHSKRNVVSVGRWNVEDKNNNNNKNNDDDNRLPAFLVLRGGAKSSKKKRAKSASLSSSRSATGKKKVGAALKEEQKKSKSGELLTKYKNILPLTRIQITLIGVTTVIGLLLGEELSQGIMALDPLRLIYGLQIWRPITAASFLGKPSISWLMSGYYLFEYGSSLERAYGTAQHLIFLLTEMVILSTLSMILGQPFYTNAMITAMLHVLSRAMPNQKVKWLIFTVPYWALPYGLMATDILQGQSVMAAIPHIIGILSGHFYHFHKFIWPKTTHGEDWLNAPDFLVTRLDPNARVSSKDSIAAALSKSRRKRGKGRKLSG